MTELLLPSPYQSCLLLSQLGQLLLFGAPDIHGQNLKQFAQLGLLWT